MIAALEASGANAVIDEDFARDVEEGIKLKTAVGGRLNRSTPVAGGVCGKRIFHLTGEFNDYRLKAGGIGTTESRLNG